MNTFSPALWDYSMRNKKSIWERKDVPTLMMVEDAFGAEAADLWIYIEISSLFITSSNDKRGVSEGIKSFASCFAAKVRCYQLSVLLLFFGRYRAGEFDESYATFDARRIGNAFDKFCEIWSREQDVFERERNVERVMQNTQKPSDIPEGYTSLTWYQELKRRESQGDIEAHLLLHPEERNFSA
jgi:hypothetical protein